MARGNHRAAPDVEVAPAYFLVFTGRKWRNAMGQQGITWEIAGVWQADNEEQACLIAAQEKGVGTCFAVEGFAWGVDTVDAGRVKQLGMPDDPITRLERMGERLSGTLGKVLEASSRQELNRGGDDDGE